PRRRPRRRAGRLRQQLPALLPPRPRGDHRRAGREAQLSMPSLALDAPATYRPDQKRAFAERLGAVYAEVMETELETITVIVHDGGEGAVWRCTASGPVPGALLMCDIRRGRPPGQR